MLKAHATTGKSVSEIQAMLDDGATISDNGTLVKPDQTGVPTEGDDAAPASAKTDGGGFLIAIPIAVGVVAVLALRRRGKKKQPANPNDSSSEV